MKTEYRVEKKVHNENDWLICSSLFKCFVTFLLIFRHLINSQWAIVPRFIGEGVYAEYTAYMQWKRVSFGCVSSKIENHTHAHTHFHHPKQYFLRNKLSYCFIFNFNEFWDFLVSLLCGIGRTVCITHQHPILYLSMRCSSFESGVLPHTHSNAQ